MQRTSATRRQQLLISPTDIYNIHTYAPDTPSRNNAPSSTERKKPNKALVAYEIHAKIVVPVMVNIPSTFATPN